MKGKIIDKSLTDVFIAFENGNTMDISLNSLPESVKVGDTVDIPFDNNILLNDKLIDFF
ncbi:hypothetical protein IAI10_11500 [Clostridium sp. 19966]|uniref:hypothetical protein n=1 Tax=Clostridium sp. 19966 TaxID=2768166 RepID=UPI0028DFC78D|nr:hypothetical protein [Clostridium sp. 19966]MDT8717284.1 hypothetical protein [Clostridium sp. 19966]